MSLSWVYGIYKHNKRASYSCLQAAAAVKCKQYSQFIGRRLCERYDNKCSQASLCARVRVCAQWNLIWMCIVRNVYTRKVLSVHGWRFVRSLATSSNVRRAHTRGSASCVLCLVVIFELHSIKRRRRGRNVEQTKPMRKRTNKVYTIIQQHLSLILRSVHISCSSTFLKRK